MSVLLTNSSWKISKEAAKSLHKKSVSTVAADVSQPIFNLTNQKYVKYLSPTTENFIDSVYEICLENNVETVFPMSDDVVIPLSKNKPILNEVCDVPLSDYDYLIKAHDKFQTFDLARSLNVPVPETFIFSDYDELIEFSAIATYPLIIKPRMGGGAARSIHIVTSKDELVNFYYELIADGHLPMIQEYIPGSSEQMYMINVLYDKNHELVSFFMAKKIREYPHTGGVTTCGVSIFEQILLDYAKKIFSSLKWYGVAEIEFKLDLRDNCFKLIEINPRFWQYLKHPIACGVDFPFYLYNVSLGYDFEANTSYDMNVKFINFYKDVPSVINQLLGSNNKKKIINSTISSYTGKKVFSSKDLLNTFIWR
ncbi:carboxylate--amine ligase [Methanolobus profundi]|uniref:Predicted ATP-dependent carboligase, ATP-grasp superfamily n=1 Tax=Methanolobus profundi TaxID=487685 RepID=A0A1I4RXM6_9EURY|nr:ATP-grasp domain-containing protein [Methanolobus profundi]SFM56921.1 Predicted ATP-dependent carboligase, ATP-grasp superfamily [Methanolobus profundi]